MGSTSFDERKRAYASETDLDYLLAEDEPQAHDGFDAFDENTWDEDFTPVPATPWYRSPQARTLLIASGGRAVGDRGLGGPAGVPGAPPTGDETGA